VDQLVEIWRRAGSPQGPPPAPVIALMAGLALALVLVPALWPVTRLAVTITHEGAHAVAAVLAGRRLQGIRLHSDTSGLTVSSGRAGGPGMVAMLAAGYLGPAVVGVGAAVMLGAGLSLGLLWCYVLLLALLLLQIRNFYGLLLVLGAGGGLVAVSWYLPPQTQSALAYLITWVLLLAAPKPVLELARQRRRRRPGLDHAGRSGSHRGQVGHSDVDQLAALTRVPALVWMAFFLLVNIAGLACGAALLLPQLVPLVEGLVRR